MGISAENYDAGRLTDDFIRSLKATTKITKHTDGKGMYLELSPAGGRWWRLKYRFGGKEKRLSLGVYPDVSIDAARRKRDMARLLLLGGIDPSQAKKQNRYVLTDMQE